MKATGKNIRLHGDVTGGRNRGAFAACPEHPWARYSATAGDYWDMSDDTCLTCEECGGELELFTSSETLTPVSA